MFHDSRFSNLWRCVLKPQINELLLLKAGLLMKTFVEKKFNFRKYFLDSTLSRTIKKFCPCQFWHPLKRYQLCFFNNKFYGKKFIVSLSGICAIACDCVLFQLLIVNLKIIFILCQHFAIRCKRCQNIWPRAFVTLAFVSWSLSQHLNGEFCTCFLAVFNPA